MNEKLRKVILIVIQLGVAVLECIGIVICYRDFGWRMIQYYTEDSNIFSMLACLNMAAFTLRELLTGKETPQWACRMSYMATCYLTLTFLVVLFVLGPDPSMGGYMGVLVKGASLEHHTLCPIFSVLSFLFLEKEPLGRHEVLVSLIPTFVYGAVVIILNLLHILDGPYPFLHIYRQTIQMSFFWAVLIFGGAFVISALLWQLNYFINKRHLAKK